MNITIPKHVKATNNGVIFYSNSMPENGIHIYQTPNGIQCERINNTHTETASSNKFKHFIIAIIFIGLAFVIQKLPINKNFNALTATFIFLIFCYGSFVSLCEDFFHAHISKKNNYRQRLQTAIHMVLNSYKKLDGIPNLWELEKISKFHFPSELHTKICVTFRGLVFSIASGFYLHSFHMGRILGLYFIVTFFTQLLHHHSKFFLHLEWFFITEPSDNELQLVITGLEKWISLELKIEHYKSSHKSF